MPVDVRVERGGTLPEYSSDGAAGADLRAREAVALAPGARAAVGTGIHVEIPAGHVGLVWPRSGLATFSRSGALAATTRGAGGFGSTGR